VECLLRAGVELLATADVGSIVAGFPVLGQGGSRSTFLLCQYHVVKVDVNEVMSIASEHNVACAAGPRTRRLLNLPRSQSEPGAELEWGVYPRCSPATNRADEFDSLHQVFGTDFDIKPDSTMVDKEGRLILVDYQCRRMPDWDKVEERAREHIEGFWAPSPS